MNTGLFSLFAQCHDTSSWLFVLAAHQNSKLHREFSHLCRAATYVTLTMICACVSGCGCVCVCDAVIFYSVVLALDMFSLNWSVEKHMWEWFPFTSDTLVTDWTDCSHCCLNVTLHLYSPWQKPHMLFLYIKQKQRGPVCVTAFFHFSFAYVNTALCWGKYHFSRMYLGVIFFFLLMPTFLEKLTVRMTHPQFARRHWKRSSGDTFDETNLRVFDVVSWWSWFQLLCALQGRPAAALSPN